ncbi:MAG: hypothetical protein ABSE93_09420 [Terriglobia bacterium]|jgi:hypothetical protein
MAIAVSAAGHELLTDNRGFFPVTATLTVTGMTGGATNTVPHGLPRIPRRVWFTALASGANAAGCSLDTSSVAAGFDATNIYIFTPSGVTTVLAHVEY